MNVSDSLLLIIKGDALAKFEYRGNEFKDKGFKMLSVLKKDWDSSSQTQVFKECFSFFQDFPQGEKSPDEYEKDLRLFFHKLTLSGNPMSTPFQVLFMVCGLRSDHGKLLLDFCDGMKEFEKETMETITTWCKHWDADNFSEEYKQVPARRTHKKVVLPPMASAAGTERNSDPPGKFFPTPYHHLSEYKIDQINGRWTRIEDIKNCIHCGGHNDGAKYKGRVCLRSFECLVLKQAN